MYTIELVVELHYHTDIQFEMHTCISFTAFDWHLVRTWSSFPNNRTILTRAWILGSHFNLF